jgi:acetate kinase
LNGSRLSFGPPSNIKPQFTLQTQSNSNNEYKAGQIEVIKEHTKETIIREICEEEIENTSSNADAVCLRIISNRERFQQSVLQTCSELIQTSKEENLYMPKKGREEVE